jgi:antitoxin component YwqK of YwqJK toxin-antitoxin module
MFELIASMFGRLISAISTPFRMLIVKIQRLLNIHVISGKLIQPLTKNVKKITTLRPSEKSDYVKVGRLLVFKQLFFLLIFALCAGVFIYFQIFAGKVEPAPAELTGIKTDVTFRYDDIALKEFSGIANIKSFDGGIVYIGEIVNGVCKGNGLLYARDGTLIYEGGFENNKYSGFGIKYNAGGGVEYEGEFADNLYAGTGRLYNPRGTLIYSGDFSGGRYDGSGKLYNENGELVYEGFFAEGLSHGTGTQYHPSGTLHYRGEFFKGEFQGSGELYDVIGRLIYTGAMHGGEVNYRVLLGSSMAEIEAAFNETPVIFYQEGGSSCFFYERAGVIITTGCRVRVYEWEREKENPSEGFFYMPGEPPPHEIHLSYRTVSSEGAEDSPPNGNGAMPDFVDRMRLLYFEVDKDVWVAELDLDKSKISVKRVTVIDSTPPPESGAVLIEDNNPPGMEDCIAIDYIRRHMPTAFSNITYEIDRQNRLFQRVWGISHADSVTRMTFLSGDVLMRFCYPPGEDGFPAYYSIELY